MAHIDPHQAAAESRLDRLDDEPVTEVEPADEEVVEAAVVDNEFGLHVDDPDDDLLDDDLDAGLRDDAEADVLDALAEVFNARDLDGVVEVLAADAEAPGLLGYERDNLPEAIEDLWQRRPTCCLTRGRAELEHLGVLWEHDGAEWWPVAVVHVDDVGEGQIGVLEFTDDTALLEQIEAEHPDDDLDEGARWVEWDEGTDG